MRKIYYLSTCNTCKRIIKDLQLKDRNFEFQDIKSDHVSEGQLDEMHEQTASYEALFNKRARKYKQQGLKDKNLEEKDYRRLLLDEYTFIKRPVIQLDNTFYIGNSKKTIEIVKNKLNATP